MAFVKDINERFAWPTTVFLANESPVSIKKAFLRSTRLA
jgi:hypothetical protein